VSIRVGLKLSQQVFSLDAQREAWRMIDEIGFDHLWLFDHLVAIHADEPTPVYDGWTLLASVAEVTKRTRIGLNVTGNLYRHPGLLAKIAVTVDHLSGGRLEMGIGAGWNEPEFVMYGMPFPQSAAERIDRLDEACQVLKALWTEPRASFDGRYYRLVDAIAEPKPLQRPHPPLWVGGNGPRRTLRVAAKRADVWSCDVCPRWNSVPGSVCDLARGEIIASNVRPRRPGQPVLVPAVEHRTRRIFPYSTTTTKVVTPPVIVNLRRRCSHLDVRGTHLCKNLGYDRCQICCPVVHVGCPVVCEPTERVSINVRVVRV